LNFVTKVLTIIHCLFPTLQFISSRYFNRAEKPYPLTNLPLDGCPALGAYPGAGKDSGG